MKRVLKKLLLYGFLLGLIAAMLAYLFQEPLMIAVERAAREWGKKITREAIQSYGSALPAVDEIRLLRLSEKDPGQCLGWGTYQARGFHQPTLFIVQARTLRGEEAQALAALWRRLHLHTDYMAGCHEPHHVIQFRSQGTEIGEAVICFDCGNATLPGFPIRPLVSFDCLHKQESPDYLEFQATVEKQVGTAAP